MAIQIRGSGSNGVATSSTTNTVTASASPQSGDVILLFYEQDPASPGAYGTLSTTDTMGTAKAQCSQTDWSQLTMWGKISDGTEGTGFTVTSTVSQADTVATVLILYDDASGTLSFGTGQTAVDASNNGTFGYPAVTTGSADSWVVIGVGGGGNVSHGSAAIFSGWGSFTEQIDLAINGAWSAIGVGTQYVASASTIAAGAITSATNDVSLGVGIEIIRTAGGGAVNYSLTCDAGSYAIAGQDATLRRGYQLTCEAGAYVLSGQSANLIVAHQLTCDAGAYTLAGQDATLTYTAGAANYTLTCDAGAYAISGQDATLTYVAGAANYSLTCDAGAYVLAGQDATLNYVPGAGTVNYTLTCDAGAYTIAGQDANLIVAHTLVCDVGAYVIAGQDATLTYVAGAANYSLTCDAGSYVLAGQDAILTRGYQLTCEAGAYTLSGQDATLTYVDGSTPINYTLNCDAGAYVINGQDATFAFTGSSAIDTHDGFWANEYRKMFERKPKVSEVVEIVRENPKEAMAVVREMPEVKAIVYAKYPDISYSEVINNAKLQLFIAKQLLNAIESRRISDEEDDLAMLLLTL